MAVTEKFYVKHKHVFQTLNGNYFLEHSSKRTHNNVIYADNCMLKMNTILVTK
jgi:hypothetical protein